MHLVISHDQIAFHMKQFSFYDKGHNTPPVCLASDDLPKVLVHCPASSQTTHLFLVPESCPAFPTDFHLCTLLSSVPPQLQLKSHFSGIL